MTTETFRVDFLRLPFLALDLVVAAFAAYLAVTAGAWAPVPVLVSLAIAIAVGRHFGVVQVNDSGVVLYRTHRMRWGEVAGVKRVSVLGLPYLLIRRISGFSWFLPLYVTGPRSLVESLAARAPKDTELATALAAR